MAHHNQINFVTVEMIKVDEDQQQQKEIDFFHLWDLKYRPEISAESFYNEYRSLVMACLRKKGDVVMWQDSVVLTEDEQLSPTFEDFILANVLFLIDSRLPGLVRDHYRHLVGKKKSIMDFRKEILFSLPALFVEKEEKLPALSERQLER
jgi:hypothetical protein